MKKALIASFIVIFFIVIAINLFYTKVYADSGEALMQDITNNGNGSLLKLKESQIKSIEEYKQKYGSDSYGITAYILHVVQVYSIPFCFIGIIISVILKLIFGSRHLESAEKGLVMIIAVVTLTIICQVLPLVFALVVKLGRE